MGRVHGVSRSRALAEMARLSLVLLLICALCQCVLVPLSSAHSVAKPEVRPVSILEVLQANPELKAQLDAKISAKTGVKNAPEARSEKKAAVKKIEKTSFPVGRRPLFPRRRGLASPTVEPTPKQQPKHDPKQQEQEPTANKQEPEQHEPKQQQQDPEQQTTTPAPQPKKPSLIRR